MITLFCFFKFLFRNALARLSLAGMVCALFSCATFATPVYATEIEVCFTPGSDCTSQIVQSITEARRTVLVQAYSFTSAPIAKALVSAHKRGVDVQVILDKSQRSERYSSAHFLVHAGIPVWIDEKVAIAHNKVMVIDGTTVVTGSFNFTKAAQERNAENLLVIHDPDLAAQYTHNWESRRAKSVPYTGAQ